MRKSAILTAVAALLGACSTINPPATVTEPVPVHVPEAPAQPATLPRASAPAPRPATRPREVRIDNTSIESFRASWARLRASLSPTQQADLHSAVTRLTFAPYGDASNLPRNLRDSPIVPEIIRDRIAGMTYAEIIALSL